MKLPKFAPFSWVVLGWNILVILWGAFVRATDTGAGCGRHWPLSNGDIIPHAPEIAVRIEFTHRLLSGGAILLVGIMILWGFRISPGEHPVRKGLLAAGILINVESFREIRLLVALSERLGRPARVAIRVARFARAGAARAARPASLARTR